MTVVLRTVEDVDLLAVGALHHRSRSFAYAGLLSPEAAAFGSPAALGEWWAERWRWEKDTNRLTVAADGDRIVGFTYLGPSEEPGVTELYAIHVDPAVIGTGVGKLLMLDALPHLAPRAVLWMVRGNERARRFYESGGWRADGVTREAPLGGDLTVQIRMCRSA